MKITYKDLDSALRAKQLFELRQKTMLSIMDGKFREARNAQKEFAKIAVQDFETVKTLPRINFTNVPLKLWLSLAFKSLRFKIFRAFTKDTPEEKLLANEFKNYIKNSQKQELNISL